MLAPFYMLVMLMLLPTGCSRPASWNTGDEDVTSGFPTLSAREQKKTMTTWVGCTGWVSYPPHLQGLHEKQSLGQCSVAEAVTFTAAEAIS